jgi:nucleolysin TIA-1/TIAR
VIIPQNTNPIPTAISSPMSGGVMSATSGGGPGYVPRRAAPEPNKRALYVGGLDPRVTEDVLRQIFETTGHVQSVKIIPDKTVSSPSVRKPTSVASHELWHMTCLWKLRQPHLAHSS